MLGPRRKTYISRIHAFMHPETANKDKSFQSDHSKIAIATGGVLGKGPGNSTERNYLPILIQILFMQPLLKNMV
jgi:cell division protein FtsW